MTTSSALTSSLSGSTTNEAHLNPMFDSPATSNGPPRKRARRGYVCENCQQRKIKCDIAERNPCTNCASKDRDCGGPGHGDQTLPSSQVQASQRATASVRRDSNVSSGSTINADLERNIRPVMSLNEMMNGTEDGAVNGIVYGNHLQQNHTETNNSQLNPIGGTGLQQNEIRENGSQRNKTRGNNSVSNNSPYATTNNQNMVESSTSGISPSKASVQPSLSTDDAIWSHNLNRINDEASDDEGTAGNVVESPLGSTSTQSKTNSTKKRVKFGGETMAHSLFPLMDGHTELSASLESQAAKQVNRHDLRQLKPPISSHPYGKAPWVHADCQDHMDLLSHLPVEDQYYLYNTKMVFSFPQRSVCQELLRVFFISVYPLLPIVDRQATVRSFEGLYKHQKSSPLLLHAILFCSSRYVDEQILLDAGFHSAAGARQYFYSRAKILYSFDCEMDQLAVVQALILLSFWWVDYTEEKDMRYWLTCAVNLALAMGMHRTIPKSLNLSKAKRNVWRRLFWVLFTRDHNISVALGHSFSLLLNNCDLPPLCEADFEEEGLDEGSLSLLLQEQKPYHINTALKYVELAVRVEKLLLALQEVHTDEEAREVLESMSEIVSPSISSTTPNSSPYDGPSIDDPSTWTQSNICVVFLRLNHERIITLYHRRKERALVNVLRSSSDGVGVVDGRDGEREGLMHASPIAISLFDDNEDLKKIRTDIFESAVRVVRILDNLLTRDLVRFAPSFANTTAFHAFLTLVETILQTPSSHPRHASARANLATGLLVVKEMRRYWSAASWCYRLYSDLASNDFKPLKESPRSPFHSQSRSRHHSRLSSRYGSPSLTGGNGFGAWDTEFLGVDSFLYLGEANPYATDPFSDWQMMGAGSYPGGFE